MIILFRQTVQSCLHLLLSSLCIFATNTSNSKFLLKERVKETCVEPKVNDFSSLVRKGNYYATEKTVRREITVSG